MVIIRQAPVREAEHIVAAINQGGRHVEVTGRRIPYGKVGSQHVILVDDDTTFCAAKAPHARAPTARAPAITEFSNIITQRVEREQFTLGNI